MNRLQRQYTINDARSDIEYLGTRFDTLEMERKALRDDMDQLLRDEWRALELCKILKRRVDILECLLLRAFSEEGQRFMTHEVLTELRTPKQQESVQ